MILSFPSPERVSLARSTGRSVFRSQTAGRSTSQHGTRLHPHRAGSQSSPLYSPIRCGGPTVLSDLLPGRHGKLAGDLRYYSHLRGHRLFSRQGTHRGCKLNSCGHRDRWSFPRFKFCQEPSRGHSNRLQVLSVVIRCHVQKLAWRIQHDVQKISVSGKEVRPPRVTHQYQSPAPGERAHELTAICPQ